MDLAPDKLQEELSTVLTPVCLKGIHAFNISNTAKVIVKGSTNLKYITPPSLLMDSAYFKSNPNLKSNDLDATMFLDDKHTVADATNFVMSLVKIFKSTSGFLIKQTNSGSIPAYGVCMLEKIANQYNYSIYLGRDTNGNKILFKDVVSGKYPTSYLYDNLIKVETIELYKLTKPMRRDDIFIQVLNDNNNNPEKVSLTEITFIMRKNNPADINPKLYYGPDVATTPLYFLSNEWKQKHPTENPVDYERILTDYSTHIGDASYLSLAYVIHELVRGLNYSFGPYKSTPYYNKRYKVRARLDYILKLIKDNQISGLYTGYDKTFADENHFADFIYYLYNGYYDPVTKPTGDPMYDFEKKTRLVPDGTLAGVSLQAIKNNVTIEDSIMIQNIAEETALINLSDSTSPTSTKILKYLTDNNHTSVVKSYVTSSSDFAIAMLGWYYTQSPEFLTTKIGLYSDNYTAHEFYDKLAKVFVGLNPAIYNIDLPNTYMLYKGVNLFNLNTGKNKFINFSDIDLSIANIIHNPLPTSTSFKIGSAATFTYGSECCLLRIKMEKKHKVLIVPSDIALFSNEKEIILPSNGYFVITNVQYVYRKQISTTIVQNLHNIVLLIDCDYKHPDDGDILPPHTLTIPKMPAYTGVAPVPVPGPTPVSGKQSGKAATSTPFKPFVPLSGTKPPTGSTSISTLLQGLSKTGTVKPSTKKTQSASSGWKGMSGGRLGFFKNGSSRKLYIPSDIKKILSKKSDKVRSGSSRKNNEPNIISVIFDNMFSLECCADKKVSKKESANYNLLYKILTHPNAPKPKDTTVGQSIQATLTHYRETVNAFIEKHPEYEDLRYDTGFSKIKETYESVLELEKVLHKQQIGSKKSAIKTKTSHTALSKKNIASLYKKASQPRSFKIKNSGRMRAIAAAGAAG